MTKRRLVLGGRHGAQIESIQEGAVDVPMEVEEETHSTAAEEAPQDASAIKVSATRFITTRRAPMHVQDSFGDVICN